MYILKYYINNCIITKKYERRGYKMNKNLVLMALVMSMFVFGLEIAEPAAAASMKVVDHGSVKIKDSYGNPGTFTWKTYQIKTSYVEMIGKAYVPKTKKQAYMYVYIQKVSKNLVKISGKDVLKYSGHTKTKYIPTTYGYSKLTAAQCYWRYFRPSLLSTITKTMS